MVAAFIVLLVVALGGGGYIAFDIVRGTRQSPRKTIVGAKVCEDAPEPVVAEKTVEDSSNDLTDVESTPDVATETAATEQAGKAESMRSVAEAPQKAPETNAETAPDVSQVAPAKPRYIVIKYSRSFLAKLIQSDDGVKNYYSELKNKLLSYGKVKSRITWKCETFRVGKKTVAKLRLRGKTLSVCLALDPEDLNGTKYRVESLAEIKAYKPTPCAFRIKTDRRLAYAKELIEKLAADNGLVESVAEQKSYAEMYPYENDDALIGRKLIKVLTDKDAQSGTAFKPSEVRKKVAASEVDTLMNDEVAASLIVQSEGTVDRTKQAIINIDTLSQHFESGEVVTLEEIKKRVKGINKNATYIKVLARGTLDKPLTVEADSFSLQAVKMILLTGGKAVRKK